jgi:beta-glucosidase
MSRFILLWASLALAPILGASTLDDRVEALLKRMTLEEKASLTSGLDNMQTRAIPRLGIPALLMTDGPNGVRWDRSTAFPTGICLAANWDVGLAQRVGSALAREAKGKGRNMLLGPCVNINRHPFGGRNFESYGEDPWLASRVAVAWVSGLQQGGVAASTKHFAANNQETLRMSIDARVDERVLREIYFPAFEAAVKEAHTLTVMCAYNQLNGKHCSANAWLLDQVLKKEWGFQGLVVSDWGATHEGPGAAEAGLDLEMPGPGTYMGKALLGAVPESVLTEQARRILRVMFQLGLFDHATPAPDPALANSAENQAVAKEVAEGGAVLLKNEGQALPLDLSKIHVLAVIGPGAASARVGGGGSSEISPPYSISPLAGLQERLKGKVEVLYAPGKSMDEELDAVPASALRGLKAEYFSNQEFKGSPVLKRDEAKVDFDWGRGSPDPSIPDDHFSARFSGELFSTEGGDFRLGCKGDDGFRLYIGGKLLVEDWGDHAAETRSAPFHMDKGKAYPFKIEYFENTGDASIQLGWRPATDGMAEAMALAKRADAVLIFTGLSRNFEGEGSDRVDFSLPQGQDEMILALAAANPRCVVVLQSGSPVNVEPWIGKVPALMQAWYGGMEGGRALASLLVGDLSPSGKLPVTFPRRLADVPSEGNFPGDGKTVRYDEGLFVGYRHYDSHGVEPRFEFGKGLSYTHFEYSGLSLSSQAAGVGALATFSLKNVGPTEGAEVAQLYVRPPKGPLPRPLQELKAFEKVRLKPGESRTLSLPLAQRAFQYYDPSKQAWVADPGSYAIVVGSSSRDIRLKGALDLK